MFSFALTALSFAVKSQSLSQMLFDLIWDGVEVKRKSKPDYDGEVRAKPETSVAKVAHYLIGKNWRMSSEQLARTGMPSKLAILIEICWAVDPSLRPPFEEIVEYLEVEVRQELAINRGEGGGTARKSSTTSELTMRLAARKNEAQEQRELREADLGTLRHTVGTLKNRVEELEAELKEKQ